MEHGNFLVTMVCLFIMNICYRMHVNSCTSHIAEAQCTGRAPVNFTFPNICQEHMQTIVYRIFSY